MASYLEANRANWDDRVAGHVASRDYDVDGLAADPKRIRPVVTFAHREVGKVAGKSLLHLQCHIGTDTISWARLGAKVTGLDFSQKSIEAAKQLAKTSGVNVRFVLSDVYDAPSVLRKKFDVVYTGVGALCWLPDVKRWAKVVAACLRPGGLFFVHDIHPVVLALDYEWDTANPAFQNPYFETATPRAVDSAVSYAGTARLHHSRHYEWNHGLGETINALIEAGLQVASVGEYPPKSPGVAGLTWSSNPAADGVLSRNPERVPLMFSIKALKI
ncbi:MAG: class I SAM-dependent methyltransferase [Chloroflexi bacterium]|nr:class I SAM-dependent methyltransferase [Chloroflexota bacterium]